MAALPSQDRANIDKYAERYLQRETGTGLNGLSVADLRAAIDAIDDWCDTNQTAFNTAIPQPARGTLTLKQKTQLLRYVVARRAEVS